MGIFLLLLGFLCAFVTPILLLVFVILWIAKKKKLWVGISTVICATLVLPLLVGGAILNYESLTPEEKLARQEAMEEHFEQEKEKTTETTPQTEDKKSNTNSTSTKKEDTMITQFKKIGFTDAESQKMKGIFTTVGITEINNIQAVGNAGIDNLQAFKCDIYDYHADKGGISIHFTIDKRQLCFISLNGIATTNVDYAYVNIFGNVKFKTSNGTKSVTLYDKWDENGEIDNNSIGYKAVFDYENKKITKYDK